MLLAALAAISPWTIRNVALTGQLVPVHTGAGFNMLLGNRLAFARRPLSYDALWREHAEAIVGQAPRRDGPAWLWEVESDVAFLRQALAEVASRPWLVPAKVITAGTMFWYIGQTDAKSAALALFRLPVLAAGVAGLAMALRRGEFHVWPAAALAAGYWVFHWPFAPPGRLATPVMPLLIVLAASLLRAPASPTAKE
jgi:hypothetical protein